VVVAIVCLSVGLYSSGLQLHRASLSDMRPPIEEVVSHMMVYRQWQDGALREYQAHRHFHASNSRFNKESMLEVQTIFRSPYSLQSTILKQDGSDFIREHVFEKILEAESDLAAKDQADIVPKNYNFALVGKEDCEGRPCWRLALTPKRKEKFLIEGDVWVDASDYGISRVYGSPAKRLSLWVSSVKIDKRMSRIEGVWLPDKIESSSSIRFVGDVLLRIEYQYDSVKVVNGVRGN
jgi:hypothetical protein